MTYLITFLEGIFSFLSPCMLPLLPVYLTYFAGNADKERGSGDDARRAVRDYARPLAARAWARMARGTLDVLTSAPQALTVS